MTRILVAGLINIETTLRVAGFPIAYNPVNFPFFGIASTVSGVGYNVAKALTVLGNDVDLLSLIGDDIGAQQARRALAAVPLADDGVLSLLPETCQSVIHYDPAGRRQIYTDLKDIQERAYPGDHFATALARADACAICNINFMRPYLHAARASGKLIATDVHALAELDDAYNADYMAAADVLFMSHERLPAPPEEWASAVLARYPVRVLVIGMGEQGALLAVRDDGYVGRVAASETRAVVSTIGAGDALFSAFLDSYVRARDPYTSMRRAILFASWKIGVASASEGFLTAPELEQLAAART